MQLSDSSDDSPNVLVFQVTEHMYFLRPILTKLVHTFVSVCVDTQSNCLLKASFLIVFAVTTHFCFCFLEVKYVFWSIKSQ